MKEKLTKLIEIKKIIALLLTLVFCFLAAIGKITTEQFITIFTVIIGFYFGQSTVKQAIKENK